MPTDYHWPTDTPDRVDYARVADAARLCLALVRRLAPAVADWGKQLYLKRQGTAEPVFGQIKSTEARAASYAGADRPSGRSGGS